jgi:hypothetical protein
VLGIKRHPVGGDFRDASVPELLEMLFTNSPDPVLGILLGLERDACIMSAAMGNREYIAPDESVGNAKGICARQRSDWHSAIGHRV